MPVKKPPVSPATEVKRETPKITYNLSMFTDDDLPAENVDLTAEQYAALRRQLAGGKPTAVEVPKWVTETYDLCSGHFLCIEDRSVHEERIELTRDEYSALKDHLAKLRGYAMPEVK